MICDWDPVDIASRARQYDPEAFAALFDVFFEKIRRFVYFHVGDAALADDLAAEVFRQAIESIGSFKDRGGTIGAWLYGIARNVVASHQRLAGRTPTVQLHEGLPSREEDAPEARVLARLSYQDLYAAMARLPEEQREILILRFIEGYNVKTVAKILKKREGAVRAQQHRAIVSMRKLYSDEERME